MKLHIYILVMNLAMLLIYTLQNMKGDITHEQK